MENYNEETFQTVASEVLKATTDNTVSNTDRLELFTAILKDMYRDGRVYGQWKAIKDFTHDLQEVIAKHDDDKFAYDLQGVISDFQEYEGEDW